MKKNLNLLIKMTLLFGVMTSFFFIGSSVLSLKSNLTELNEVVDDDLPFMQYIAYLEKTSIELQSTLEKTLLLNPKYFKKYELNKDLFESSFEDFMEQYEGSPLLEELDTDFLARGKLFAIEKELLNSKLAGDELDKKLINYEKLGREYNQKLDLFLNMATIKISEKQEETIHNTLSNYSNSRINFFLSVFIWLAVFIMFFLFEKKNKALQASLEAEKLQRFNASRMATLGEMATSVAHEINNPMTIISGSILMLKRKTKEILDSKPELIDYINNIEVNSNRVVNIVQGVKSISDQSVDEELSEFNLGEILEDIEAVLSSKLKEEDIKLIFPESIKEDAEKLMAAKGQLIQTLLILLNNSIDALKDSKDKRIEINFKVQEEMALISIHDSGPGIPTDIEKRIFDPFFTTKDIGEGTGLGLNMARKMIEGMSGELSLEKVERGTCFILKFPMNKAKQILAA